jgi:hypothetical protein
MEKILARCVFAAAIVLSLVAVQGCKKQPAPAVEPTVRVLPPVRTLPDFSTGPLPVEHVSAKPGVVREQNGMGRVDVQPTQQSDPQARLASQRRQDARLLQQQQAASQRQQQELNQEVQANVKAQQKVQSEQRIQEVPEVPITQPVQPPQV